LVQFHQGNIEDCRHLESIMDIQEL
jgi:hypothetical protein